MINLISAVHSELHCKTLRVLFSALIVFLFLFPFHLSYFLFTIFLPGGPPGCLGEGASLNMSCCCLGGSEEYKGYTAMGPNSSPIG